MGTPSPDRESAIPKYRLFFEIAAVAVVILAIVSLAKYNPTPPVQTIAEPVPPPPMTELMEKVLETSTGFQHLVSYTDHGFEPAMLDVKKGETVRFSNNSSHDLWVASAASPGERLYPAGAENICGQSAFDSCVSMKPMEFWEFTFDAEGEWSYRNNAFSENRAVVQVQ